MICHKAENARTAESDPIQSADINRTHKVSARECARFFCVCMVPCRLSAVRRPVRHFLCALHVALLIVVRNISHIQQTQFTLDRSAAARVKVNRRSLRAAALCAALHILIRRLAKHSRTGRPNIDLSLRNAVVLFFLFVCVRACLGTAKRGSLCLAMCDIRCQHKQQPQPDQLERADGTAGQVVCGVAQFRVPVWRQSAPDRIASQPTMPARMIFVARS